MAYVTAEDLQKQLENLADELGISVSEALAIITGKIDTNKSAIETLTASVSTNAQAITAITEMADNGVESLAEKVKALNDMFKEDDTLATDVLNRIATNATATGANATEIEALKTAKDNIEARVSDLETKVDNNNIAVNTSLSNLEQKVDSNKAVMDANKVLADKNKADLEALATQVASQEGSGLVTGVICGRKAANKFRIQLGQATKVFDCGTDTGDGATT